MGPFVPDLISNPMNLLLAFLLGIAFGFVLEQAGFSSSRKLTGLFYGTDFTVLRVFFTAGVTAMSGVLIFNQMGWLDLDLIYINPMFLQSAIAGGVIMGVGFVLGGYCPGTSFVGASVGRIDGMAFVGGGFLGVFAFGEAFPLVEGIYKSGAMGDLLVYNVFGLSAGQFAGMLIAVAVGAFIFTSKLERKIAPDGPAASFPVTRHRTAAALLLVLAAILAAVPDRRARLDALAADPEYRKQNPVRRVSADELAFHLIDGNRRIQLIDVRTAAKSTLPDAINLSRESLLGKEAGLSLAPSTVTKIFFGDTEEEGTRAALTARLAGFDNVAALEGGLQGFRNTILTAQPGASDVAQFRATASRQILAMIRERSAPKPVRTVKRVQGGCGG